MLSTLFSVDDSSTVGPTQRASEVSRRGRALRGASIAIGLFVVLELALRVFGFAFAPLDLPLRVWNSHEDEMLEDESSLHCRDAGSLWAPRPAATIPWNDGERVNADGFRGPIVARERTRGTLRIATLGDSSTFGVGVPWKDCWSAVLARKLNEGGIATEVVDGGVIGFTARQGVERYVECIRPFHPDVVVAAFGSVNEHHAGNAAQDDSANIATSRARDSFGFRAVRAIREASRVVQLVDLARCTLTGERKRKMAEWRSRQDKMLASQGDVDQADWSGVRRVSPVQFTEALRELRRAVEADGAQLVLVSMPRADGIERDRPALMLYTRALEQLASSENVALADARARFAERAHDDPDAALFLPGDAWHPSAIGHALLADTVLPLVRTTRPK